ncbi:MAG TPA: sigma-70 family RNA polymerase sigma factor [Patescibacteria group bacterium]|nr:sigma-70 family RNA polymerase sigma factor [Patescibacteria group bacterium]
MQGGTDEQDREDMLRLAAGHDAGLSALMNRHGERLFHYLLRQLNNETEAADLAQESFVRVYQNAGRFRPDQRFSTWLYTIATNLLRDRFRWHKRHPQVSLEAETETGASLQDAMADSAGSPSEQIESSERAEEVRRAVQALPVELRTPLILFEYESLSHAEIGAVLNCSAKAVEVRLYRARGQLRKQLEKKLQVC